MSYSVGRGCLINRRCIRNIICVRIRIGRFLVMEFVFMWCNGVWRIYFESVYIDIVGVWIWCVVYLDMRLSIECEWWCWFYVVVGIEVCFGFMYFFFFCYWFMWFNFVVFWFIVDVISFRFRVVSIVVIGCGFFCYWKCWCWCFCKIRFCGVVCFRFWYW